MNKKTNQSAGNNAISRKKFLYECALGTVGLAGWAVLGGCKEGSFLLSDKRGPATHSIQFNTGWRFGEAVPGSFARGFDDSGFDLITLPHVVADLSWHQWDPESWQKVWMYRKNFNRQGTWAGQRVFLEIGAAMTAAMLTLNGHKVGEHFGGYLPLHYELTNYLMSGENVLAVELDSRFDIDVPPNYPGQGPTRVDYWQPGGLYRTAQLHIVPPVFLSDVFAKPVDVLKDKCRLELACTIDAATVPDKPVRIEAVLREGRKVVSKGSIPVHIVEGKQTVTLTLNNLGDIHLWDVNDPYLYDVKVTLLADDTPIHDHAVRTGFRQAEFTKQGFYLNGRRLQLFGANRHQLFPYAGGAMPPRVQAKDAEILRRQLNCNMVRCSHYPQSEAFFDACDELGLMAWEEVPGWGGGKPLGDKEWKQRALSDVEYMILRDRNHPSIIIWGARMNETADDREFYTETHDLAHRLDGSRPTAGTMPGLLHTKNYVQDVFAEDDYSSTTDKYGRKQPVLAPPRTDRPYMITESVGTLSGPAKYYRRFDPVIDQQGQAEAHARVHNLAASDPRYCGLLAWSGLDYPSGSGNQYKGIKYTGVVNLFRMLKPGAAIYQAQIGPDKGAVIAPAFYWEFGPDALPLPNGIPAMICSNCDLLEVFVGGEHYATVKPDVQLYGNLSYPPSFVDFSKIDGASSPELRIDGYVGEDKVLSRRFSTDLSGDRLQVTVDDQELIADGVDATRVAFEVVDQYGNSRRHTGGTVTINIEGPGRLVGETPFSFKETGGVGAVWIRTQAEKSGKITIKATHDSLGSGSVDINVRPQKNTIRI